MNNLEKHLAKKKLAQALMQKEAFIRPLAQLAMKHGRKIYQSGKNFFSRRIRFRSDPKVSQPGQVRGTLKNYQTTQAGGKLLTQPAGKAAISNPDDLIRIAKKVKQFTPAQGAAFNKAISKRQKGDLMNTFRQQRRRLKNSRSNAQGL